MPLYQQIDQLMFFSTLDAYSGPGVLTIGWRITDKPEDPWTARFNAFKSRDARAVRAGATVAAASMSGMQFRGGPPSLVVGAISSAKEALEQVDPIWQLGKAVAEALRAPWRPTLLTKQAHRSLHNISGGAAARAAEVHGKYKASGFKGAKTVLVVDDFITRGDTLTEIARAITDDAGHDVAVFGFALAKTERASWANIDNAHVPERLASIWDGVK